VYSTAMGFIVTRCVRAFSLSLPNSEMTQVGTLNYMSPEAILGGSNNILGGPAMKVGRPSDIWSLGCILYQMVYGRWVLSVWRGGGCPQGVRRWRLGLRGKVADPAVTMW
jgi:serine/threonine protein kinase